MSLLIETLWQCTTDFDRDIQHCFLLTASSYEKAVMKALHYVTKKDENFWYHAHEFASTEFKEKLREFVKDEILSTDGEDEWKEYYEYEPDDVWADEIARVPLEKLLKLTYKMKENEMCEMLERMGSYFKVQKPCIVEE